MILTATRGINYMLIKIFFVILSFVFISNAFAVIPIYCPECKTHLYDYQYDEITVNQVVYAKDFKPIGDIIQPVEESNCDCPLCKSPLNGWEYMGKKYKSFTNMCGAFSLLTKDDSGFKWIPYDVPDTEYTRE